MAPHVLTEDEIYRSSTQYRLWSFTPEALASIRSSNNTAASEQAQVRLQAEEPDVSRQNDPPNLTTTEELALLAHSTRTLIQIGLQSMGLPTPVTATGAVYLRRFYLSNSPLTNPPRTIMPTCLFLATKTEHYYVPLSTFVQDWTASDIQPDDIIREEGTVTQALRFSFEVRHPFRGLRGALLELRALAEGKGAPVPASHQTAAEAQSEMLALRKPGAAPASTSVSPATPQQAQDRAFQAHDRAKEILTHAGLLTDVYFLYTPAQMMFAALLLADEPLARFYLSTKLARPPPAQDDSQDAEAARHKTEAFNDKLLSTIRACAELLSAAKASEVDKDAGAEIERKLAACRSRLGWDELGANAGSKRNGLEGARNAEKAAKKRKLANGAAEAGSPFGGPLHAAGRETRTAEGK